MKIAGYHPWIYLKGGAERTLLELVRRSRHDWTLFTNHYDPEGTFPEFRDVHVVELSRVSVQRSLLQVGQAVLKVMAQRVPVESFDALMISSEGLGNLVPLRCRDVPVFCFCHTPLKVVYDPFTRARYFAQSPGILTRLAINLYVRLDRLGWRCYDRVFCNSHEVASRVLNASLTSPERVEVLHPGVDLSQFDHQGPREPYFLLPGRIARTKNVELGIDAFRRLKASTPRAAPFRLIVAGMVDQKSQPYFRSLRSRAEDGPDVSFVVNPSDVALRDLYRSCYATLFTALNEDWGLVALEAMASAKPVIAVRRGGPLESIVHGETGLLYPPDAEEFAFGMASLIEDPSRGEAMGQRGRRRAAAFSWDGFVQRIDDYVGTLGKDVRPTVPKSLATADLDE